MVAKRVTLLSFIAIFVLGSAGGALAFYALNSEQFIFVIGASGAVSAFTGAACRFAFPKYRQFSMNVDDAPLQGIFEIITNRQAVTFISVWLIINFIFGAGIVPMNGQAQSIAWEAHIGGFLVGLFVFPLLDISNP